MMGMIVVLRLKGWVGMVVGLGVDLGLGLGGGMEVFVGLRDRRGLVMSEGL